MAKYENYKSNLDVLKKASDQDLSNEFVVGGIINKFSLQFELSWKLLKEALEYEGRKEAFSGAPRLIIKAAYSTYDFIDEPTWLSMLDARNEALHVYNSELAEKLARTIISDYIPAFESLLKSLQAEYPEAVLESF